MAEGKKLALGEGDAPHSRRSFGGARATTWTCLDCGTADIVAGVWHNCEAAHMSARLVPDSPAGANAAGGASGEESPPHQHAFNQWYVTTQTWRCRCGATLGLDEAANGRGDVTVEAPPHGVPFRSGMSWRTLAKRAADDLPFPAADTGGVPGTLRVLVLYERDGKMGFGCFEVAPDQQGDIEGATAASFGYQALHIARHLGGLP